MATVQEIYNEIDRIDNAKSGIAGAIEEKGVEVPAGAKIDEYPELVRQIQQGDTSDCVKFTPQTLTEEQKAQARENIGAVGGKMGVISQTQTWSGSGSNPRTYVMSGQVTGLIPQANIELFARVGAIFNETTGYFELNGLTDLSYNEMMGAYLFANLSNAAKSVGSFLQGSNQRTNISTWEGTWNQKLSCAQLFYSSNLESIDYKSRSGSDYTNANSNYMFGGNVRLRKIGTINMSDATSVTSIFMQCYSLEEVSIKGLKVNISFSDSSALTAASVAYMITNAGTATITITLHATAYARATADAGVQAALAAKTNVSLASA